MAGEVDPQSDVSPMGAVLVRSISRPYVSNGKSLHSKWSQPSLLCGCISRCFDHVVNSIDHTMLFASLEDLVGEIPIGDWLICSGRTDLLASMFQSFWVLV